MCGAGDIRVHAKGHDADGVLAFGIETLERVGGPAQQGVGLMLAADHNRDVIDFDGIGDGHQRLRLGFYPQWLVIQYPVTEPVATCGRNVFQRVELLGSSWPKPAARAISKKLLQGVQRLPDHGCLILNLMYRHLDVAMRHEFPTRVACRFYDRSEEHTSELQSLMRISYAVFCFKK